jgi:hypothetical protein
MHYSCNYTLEPPNINTPRYVPRFRPKVPFQTLEIDLGCYAEEDEALFYCNGNRVFTKAIVCWQLLSITEWADNKTKNFMAIYPTPKALDLAYYCTSDVRSGYNVFGINDVALVADRIDGLYGLIKFINKANNLSLTLNTITKFEYLQDCLALGYPVVVGGSVYESFLEAAESGIVPMPKRDESLLGGHAFCLVGYHKDSDTYEALANFGPDFGAAGRVRLYSTYLRNLNICRDFYMVQRCK